MSDDLQYSQIGRLLRIDTPLGEDVLLLEKFEGREEISELFAFVAVVRSTRTDLQQADLVGRLVDVSIDLTQGDGQLRSWNLLCVALHEGSMLANDLRHYTLVLRPQLWLLTRRADCRIFLSKSSVEICQLMLSEHGLPAPDTSGLVGPVPPPSRDYSVQWNETDLAYLDRRLEQDGVFYYFVHRLGQHVMHLANHQTAYRDLQPDTALRLSRGSSDRNQIFAFDRTYRFIPSQRAARDWNFETPARPPEGIGNSNVSGQIEGGSGGAKYELYEYPGRFMQNNAGEGAMRNRMQAAETDHDRVVGQSRVRPLMPARRFTPYDLSDPGQAYQPHIATRVTHQAEDPSYNIVSGVDAEPALPSYTNAFEATLASVPATPHRDTPQPRIDGAQIAIVAGPPGEEIHTDAYGRVKLRFPWDRRARGDGTDTVWVRVSQPWAGGTWGAQVIPRVGMEVLVTYEDGDPDRPLVTGVVPNPSNPVPYGLPGNKTRMVIRSRTYKAKGANEFTMEDGTGAENLFTHAQRDQTGRVLNNHTHRVDAHAVTSIGQNQSVEVGGNHKTEVGGSVNITVGGTGPGALALMQQLTGLAPLTAGLLQQASGVAGAGQLASGIMAASIASSALGFLSGVGLGSREGVVAGPSPIKDAGNQLRQSGTGVAADVGGILSGLPGVMNTVVGAVNTRSVGIADVEQVGVSKVVNVGASSIESVGKYKKIAVGEEFVIECGKSKFVMKNDGTVLILGTTFNFIATGHYQMQGDPIDCN